MFLVKKFYAVKRGYNSGIYETWNECKKQIEGYSGAVYKSFKNIMDAKEFLSDENENIDADLVAYVDGSYDENTNNFSYGMVILHEGEEVYFYEKFSDDDLCTMRNVAGEIMGAMKAMKYCLETGFKNIVIYFDYEGIEKWCKGYWKTNKIGTQNYKRFYDSIKNDINVIFKKVKAHSGNKYNELADKLAKRALKV